MLHGYGPAIVDGLGLTLRVAAASLAVACAFGLAGAAARLAEGASWPARAARAVALAYTTLIRGLPELVLMLMVFYGGQGLVNAAAQAAGLEAPDIDPYVAGTLTLGFIFGAYLTETFRGAILAIPRGQIEAARAIGMSPLQVLARIVVPQMIRHALPGFTNNWLVMVKATALVSIIGLDDMVHRAGLAAAATRAPFTFYVAVGALYLAITSVSLLALHQVERRVLRSVRRPA